MNDPYELTPAQQQCDHVYDGPNVPVDHWHFVTSDTCSKCGVAGAFADEAWQ